jgi:hypothetical protein
MSAGKWDEIEFDKIPSKAGMIYKNAFARHDLERVQSEKNIVSYADFAKDKDTKVNAKALYPYECVAEALKLFRTGSYWNMRELPAMDDTTRLMVNKYWENLTDYFNGATFNGIAVVDTSGSMVRDDAAAPINVAISLGLYCAERAQGPFAGNYISFASRPQLIKTEGVDFVDKVQRIYKTNLVDDTNIEATFDLMLNTAIQNRCSQDDLPQNVIIISDMEFNACVRNAGATNFKSAKAKFEAAGYKLPEVVFWNVASRNRQQPVSKNEQGVALVSGCTPRLFSMIAEGVPSPYEFMMSVIESDRYKNIAA